MSRYRLGSELSRFVIYCSPFTSTIFMMCGRPKNWSWLPRTANNPCSARHEREGEDRVDMRHTHTHTHTNTHTSREDGTGTRTTDRHDVVEKLRAIVFLGRISLRYTHSQTAMNRARQLKGFVSCSFCRVAPHRARKSAPELLVTNHGRQVCVRIRQQERPVQHRLEGTLQNILHTSSLKITARVGRGGLITPRHQHRNHNATTPQHTRERTRK